METNGKWTIAELWRKACEYDNIPADSKFCVFSDNNPWARKYNFGMLAMMQHRRLILAENIQGDCP